MRKFRGFSILMLLIFAVQWASAQTPVAYAGPDQDLCEGDTVQLQGSGTNAGPLYTYQWSPSTFLSDPTIANPLAWPPSPIEYTLVVTSNSLSSLPDTVRITPHPIPTADAGSSQGICLGDTAQLDGSASGDPLATYLFSWSPSLSLTDPTLEDPRAFPLQNTTYYLVAQSLWGCESPVDSVSVVIRPTPLAEAGSNQIVCLGDSFQLQGSYVWATADSLPASQLTHLWSPGNLVSNPGAFVTSALADSTQWFYFQVNTGTCTRTDSVFVSAFPRPTPVIMQSGNDLFANGGLGGGTYQWLLNHVPIPNANGSLYSVTQPGCYSVIVSEGDCAGESDTLCIQSVGLAEKVEWAKVEAFPNPFFDEINLRMELPQGEKLRVVLVDLGGKVVGEIPARKWGSGPQEAILRVAGLPEGLYWLRVEGESGSVGRMMRRGAKK